MIQLYPRKSGGDGDQKRFHFRLIREILIESIINPINRSIFIITNPTYSITVVKKNAKKQS